ncbi:uncharacterized protein LOC125647659 isoform X1 [Ostrea edulis]|uniref:uncharacterized protein LOC125647659 isoform X1 n=1 Tax=Ostrea edulis TaxID=37623 RepID=UPI0024AFE520|nr:uncharacterized protein LOC125647659 isoform X1 [Ostrea edulis]
MLSKIYVWIVVFSFGLYVSCEPCSNKTKDCPKTVTVLKTMSKVIYETCYKATKTCWGWNVLKIKCKYKSRSDRCTKHKSYYITTTMVLPGCCEGYTEEEDCCVKGSMNCNVFMGSEWGESNNCFLDNFMLSKKT